MKAWMLMATAVLAFAMTATQALAQTGPAPIAQPERVRDGDRSQVERLQKALKDSGHDPGPIDGVIGAETTAALRAYQKEHGLSPTGRLDDPTLAKLGEQVKSAEPSAADPAQATKTGANVGEGASYSRSTEKGLSK